MPHCHFVLMSLAIGVASNSESMGFDDKSKEGATTPETHHHAGKYAATDDESGDEKGPGLSRHMSESSVALTEDDDDDVDRKIELGPQFTLKEQLEKDKVNLLSSSSFLGFVILKDLCFVHLCVCVSFMYVYVVFCLRPLGR